MNEHIMIDYRKGLFHVMERTPSGRWEATSLHLTAEGAEQEVDRLRAEREPEDKSKDLFRIVAKLLMDCSQACHSASMTVLELLEGE